MDVIANMAVMLKNASNANHEVVVFPYSKLKHEIVNCLQKSGYVRHVTKKTRKGFPVLEVGIVYNDGVARINDITRISKPSRRVYMGTKELKPFKYGRGMVVLSTPKGIMSDKEAKKELVGGEALLSIW